METNPNAATGYAVALLSSSAVLREIFKTRGHINLEVNVSLTGNCNVQPMIDVQ